MGFGSKDLLAWNYGADESTEEQTLTEACHTKYEASIVDAGLKNGEVLSR